MCMVMSSNGMWLVTSLTESMFASRLDALGSNGQYSVVLDKTTRTATITHINGTDNIRCLIMSAYKEISLKTNK